VEAPRKPTTGMIVARRMRLCDFFAQAGWFDLADEELNRLLKDFPDQKKRVEDGREVVGKLRARAEWEEIKNWYHAGRYNAVSRRLVQAEQNKHATDRVLADMREMKDRLASDQGMLAQATAALDECGKQVTTPEGRALLSAVAVLKRELNAASIGRLDAFLSQARESARQKARNKKPAYTPDQLLALAVSGWLLGSPSAESQAESAVNLWKTRQMILEYCQETDQASRKKILAKYEKEITPRIDLDEIAQLIESLPPVEPGQITKDVTEVSVGKGRNATKYHLQLPPEYTHRRSYPVLIVLANGGEKPAAALARWEKAAAEHGYILAAPEWETGLKNKYNYSEREHDSVLNTVRDLRQRYQIDSDRVFLFGLGEGGKMAWDVGLAHPDLFAGIVPMNAGLKFFPRRYWHNAQYLPIYAVTGTRASDSNEGLRDIFTLWVQRGYPALWVEYKGRGMEWLGGEVPNIFDWMRNQQRAFPLAASSAPCAPRTIASTG
jgi:hypothetical protein